MIVRILGEGQWDLPEESVDSLNQLDAAVEGAITAGDEAAFTAALAALLGAVRTGGTPRPAESLDESDVILPPSDASLEEVREMLEEDGLIPG